MRLLNVGGGASRALPPDFEGWEQDVLDIDESVKPDILGDARAIAESLPPQIYDAVYCSHNLEHYYRHEVPQVLAGFRHVLKRDGFARISVPNLQNLISEIQSRNLDLDDVWYRVGGALPVTFHDVLYGWSIAMSKGNLYYAHKCGFTPLSLEKTLTAAGFASVQVIDQGANILATARQG